MRDFRLLLCCVIFASCSRGTVGTLPLAAGPSSDALDAGRGFVRSFAFQSSGDITRFKSLYSFKGGTDGANPNGALLDVDGALYGVSDKGGNGGCTGQGCGTVYKISPSGSESVLYRFTGGAGGFSPLGVLVYGNGELYGTTYLGGGRGCGGRGCGVAFEVSPSGVERALHIFTGGSDGGLPGGGLIDVRGALYGVTEEGGGSGCFGSGCGTVFKITPSGTETLVYRFKGGSDGAAPIGPPILVGGSLYGTTLAGGASGWGTVFKISPTGKESVLYAFGKPLFSASPSPSGLTYLNGFLYGMTQQGPANIGGGGTVYKVSLSGAASVLHAFAGPPDGAKPVDELIGINGTLYATTTYGGTGCPSRGCGTVFKITPSGMESVLYSLKGGASGGYPLGLLDVNGVLYGPTYHGGAGSSGTVFSLSL